MENNEKPNDSLFPTKKNAKIMAKNYLIVIASIIVVIGVMALINLAARLLFPEPSRMSEYITGALLFPVGAFVIIKTTDFMIK